MKAFTLLASLVILMALACCSRVADFTPEQKADLAKKCTDASMVAEVHSNWVVCRNPNQVSDE